jgi:hypothetical protein
MATSKMAVIILSDPNNGEEALGRAFNGLAAAHEGIHCAHEVEIIFSGAGTRWPDHLSKLSHPANALYNAVLPHIKGASCGCAALFGATDSIKASSIALLADQALGGTPGIANLQRYVAEGWQTLTF